MNSSTKIESCSNCNSQYRIPTDKSILATCPNCKQKFQYKYGAKITYKKNTGRVFLKIVATIIFCMIWGSIQSGCQAATRNGSGAGYALVNIFGLILLVAGIYGIWKFNPDSVSNDDNQKLEKS